jgi:hypothetical protein
MASHISSIATEALGGWKYFVVGSGSIYFNEMEFLFEMKRHATTNPDKFVKKISQQMKIEHWKFDNAGENKATKDMFEENGFGIKIEMTAREMPQQNGMVERAFATLYGRMRAMFTNAGFEKLKQETLWAECAATATKLDNILIDTSEKKSPYEIFYGKTNKIAKH